MYKLLSFVLLGINFILKATPQEPETIFPFDDKEGQGKHKEDFPPCFIWCDASGNHHTFPLREEIKQDKVKYKT